MWNINVQNNFKKKKNSVVVKVFLSAMHHCNHVCVFVCFSGQDGGYGLESEEVILTPEDENPLRRILQACALSVSLSNYLSIS